MGPTASPFVIISGLMLAPPWVLAKRFGFASSQSYEFGGTRQSVLPPSRPRPVESEQGGGHDPHSGIEASGRKGRRATGPRRGSRDEHGVSDRPRGGLPPGVRAGLHRPFRPVALR